MIIIKRIDHGFKNAYGETIQFIDDAPKKSSKYQQFISWIYKKLMRR